MTRVSPTRAAPPRLPQLPPPTPPPPLIGRARETAFLEELAASGRAELFVLYGRRRVGKTELLQRFCQGRKAVYFFATEVRLKDNLRALGAAIAEGLDDPLAAEIEFPDLSAALAYLAERARDERLVVVLDEFPYLCDGARGVPSQVQRFWDTRGKQSRMLLVLCGSQVSFMEKAVLAERSPLFGRRTAQRRLEPLSALDALSFFPEWKVADRVLAYAVLGGMPAYLQRFDSKKSLRENLLAEVLRPEGYLFDEVNFLLRSELSNPATYASILAACARGAARLNDVALEAGIDSTTAGKYLHVLRELRLVEREIPITDPNPLRSRRGAYRVADRFVSFHFKHIQPQLSLIHAGRGARVLERAIEPDLPRLFDDARVDLILEHLKSAGAELAGEELVEVGRFDGEFVRALARGASGRGVAAVVIPDSRSGARRSTAALEREEQRLEELFGAPLTKLVYGITDRPERPLEVERVPDGELL